MQKQKNQYSTFYQTYNPPYFLDDFEAGCGVRKRPPSSDYYSTSIKRNRNPCCETTHVNFHKKCNCTVRIQPLCQCDCYMLPSLYHKLLSAPYTTLAKKPKPKPQQKQNKVIYIERSPPPPTFIARPQPTPPIVTFNMQPQNIGRTLVNYLIPSHHTINQQQTSIPIPIQRSVQPVVSFTAIPNHNATSFMPQSSLIPSRVSRTSILKPTSVEASRLVVPNAVSKVAINQPISTSTYSIQHTSSVQENPNGTSRKIESKQQTKVCTIPVEQSKPQQAKKELSFCDQNNRLGILINEDSRMMSGQSVYNNLTLQHKNSQQVSYSSSVSRSQVKHVSQYSEQVQRTNRMMEQGESNLNGMLTNSRDATVLDLPAIAEQSS